MSLQVGQAEVGAVLFDQLGNAISPEAFSVGH
jgi:hypothetical protein